MTMSVEAVGVGLGVFSPFLLKLLIDGFDNGERDIALWLVVGFVCTWVGAALASNLRSVYSSKVTDLLCQTLIQRALRAQLYELSRPGGGDSAQVIADIERLPTSLQTVMDGVLWRVVPLLLQVGFSLILVSHVITSSYAFVLASTLIGYFAVTRITATWHVAAVGAMCHAQASASGLIADLLRNSRRIAFNGMVEPETTAALNRLSARRRATERMNWSLVRLYGMQFVVLGAGLLTLLSWGAGDVLAHRITAGDFIMLHTYALRLVMPLSGLGYTLNQAGVALTNIGRVKELGRTGDIQPVAPAPPTGPARITLRNLSAGYADGRPILKNLNLDIEPGAFVAIVGANGSGKSTLAQVIAGIIEPQSGRVEIDGQVLADIPYPWRHQYAMYVPQRSELLNRSLAENGLYPPSQQTLDYLSDLLKAWRFMDKTGPLDLSVEVGEQGTTLSGGQVQKLELARLTGIPAPVLILDEATSALDAQSEEKVLLLLKSETFEHSTKFFITHKPEVAKSADQIIFIEEGTISAIGTHFDLCKRHPSYRRHWQQ
ncbi:hypothetical protein AEYBE204_09845 [Asticcacaulis sp. YBE204]|nr:hypothetical protein AEYBE204_09845 [Asticcacaulis sp. YBE204]